jgi:2-haloacid dehalogenase/putative hydrolase of the HAD superfamily
MNTTAPVGLFMDFYGTITAGDRATVEGICRQIVEQHGLQVDAAELAARWGWQFFAVIERANGDRFRSLFACECESLRRVLRQFHVEVQPEPYVRQLREYWRRPPLQPEALAALARIRLPICLVSNADDHDLLWAIRHSGLNFDHVVTSQQTQCYKPHPDIFGRALRETGWPAAAVLHVGDSLHSDIAGAHAAGLRAIWVRRKGRISDVPRATPEYTVADLHEVAALVVALTAGPN